MNHEAENEAEEVASTDHYSTDDDTKEAHDFAAGIMGLQDEVDGIRCEYGGREHSMERRQQVQSFLCDQEADWESLPRISRMFPNEEGNTISRSNVRASLQRAAAGLPPPARQKRKRKRSGGKDAKDANDSGSQLKKKTQQKKKKTQSAGKKTHSQRPSQRQIAVMQAVPSKPAYRPPGYLRMRHRDGYVPRIKRRGYIRPTNIGNATDTDESTAEDHYSSNDSTADEDSAHINWSFGRMPTVRSESARSDGDDTQAFESEDESEVGARGDIEVMFTGAYTEMDTLDQIRCVFCG